MVFYGYSNCYKIVKNYSEYFFEKHSKLITETDYYKLFLWK